MGFLDKAKAAAMDLQQKADSAMSNAGLVGGSPGGPSGGGPRGPADRLLRDLGVLTYLNAAGRPGSAADYQRIMEQLRAMESSGQLNLTLSPAAPPGYGAPGAPPPPPGAVRAAHEAAAAGGAAGGAVGGVAPPPAPPAGMPPPPPAPADPAGSPVADAAPPAPAGSPAVASEAFPNEASTPDAASPPRAEESAGSGGGTAAPPPPPSWA